MSARTLFSAAVAALVLSAPARAQQQASSVFPEDVRVLGAVVDATSGAPISGALVLLSDGRTTETDADGNFVFGHVRPGPHQIAAVTNACARVEGGFDVVSGRDSQLKLMITRPSGTSSVKTNASRGSGTRIINGRKLAEAGNLTVLEVLDREFPNLFREDGSRLATVARGGDVNQPTEPLLVLDGLRVNGYIANELRSMKATDVLEVEVQIGAAAGWEFQPGGAQAVIEVTTRRVLDAGAAVKGPMACLNGGG